MRMSRRVLKSSYAGYTRTAHSARLVLLSGLIAVQCGRSAEMLTTMATELESAPPPTESETSTDTGGAEDSERRGDTESHADTDTAACSDDGILPSEVLFVGDSWISLTGSMVGELARTDRILASNEDYIYQASAGATMEMIVRQYETYRDLFGGGIKAVIMNGGVVDTYGDLTQVPEVAATFSSFLDQLSGDGVAQVLYVLYAVDSNLPGVAEMGPLMAEVCDSSETPRCHFLDLQTIWQDGYMSEMTPNPSSQGMIAIAEATWEMMQVRCIAQ